MRVQLKLNLHFEFWNQILEAKDFRLHDAMIEYMKHNFSKPKKKTEVISDTCSDVINLNQLYELDMAQTDPLQSPPEM